MSLFQWLGERSNPGPVGGIDSGAPEPGHWSPRVILLRGVVGVALLAGAVAWVISANDTVEGTAIALALVAAYCVASYWIAPQPDYSNVGFLGGVIDHPFRWSDDVNRLLAFLRVLLWPGRFVTASVRDLVQFYRGRRILVLPPREL
jgi:hypothetical protein